MSLQKAIEESHQKYADANPKSRKAHEVACKYMPGGNTRSVLYNSPFPLTIASGQGASLMSLDGKEYIDFLSEYTAGILGHSEPRILQTVHQVLNRGWNFGAPNVYERELAGRLCNRFAPTMQSVRFTNSGTEANMCAVATAIAWTGGRRKVLVFENGYHGSTLGFRDGARGYMLLPHEWVVAAYDNMAKTKDALSRIADGELAAILLEPMQGSAGAIECSKDFLEFLRAEASRRGALLIFDEVMTSRLSYRGLGHEMGVQPDLMTLGKYVGGGIGTFGAFGGREDVMAMFDPRKGALQHAGTFNNNVVSMAAGVTALNILTEDVLRDLNNRGEYLKQQVNQIFRKHGFGVAPDGASTDHTRLHLWISGRGSILAIRAAGEQGDHVKDLLFHFLLRHGIYIAPRGFMALNLRIKNAHVQQFAETLDTFFETYGSCIKSSSRSEAKL